MLYNYTNNMSLNGSPKYNWKGAKEYIKDTNKEMGKKAALEQFNIVRDSEEFKEHEIERKKKLQEQDEKYLVGLNSRKTEIKPEQIKQQENLKDFKSIQDKIERAKKFSEGDPESDFSVSEMNELAKDIYTIKDESIRNIFAEELINIQTTINKRNTVENQYSKPEENLEEESNSKNKIEKLRKKGVGMTWPTPNKKVASYIERLFTADLSKGEHWDLVKEFSKDLAKKGSEYLITTPLGIEKNRKKIKDEIEKVMDYPGFEELIKNDKFMKRNKIKKPYQLSSLLEKLQEPGFDLFKDEQDKLKNEEKKIIKKAIDIFNYYKSTPEYLDDKNEDDEEKADVEARKKNRKLSKRLNRLASVVDKEDLKKKKRDIVGIREKADFRDFIETLEKTSGLEITEEEEYKKFIERALTKIREEELLSRGQVRDIEDYISKSEAKAA